MLRPLQRYFWVREFTHVCIQRKLHSSRKKRSCQKESVLIGRPYTEHDSNILKFENCGHKEFSNEVVCYQLIPTHCLILEDKGRWIQLRSMKHKGTSNTFSQQHSPGELAISAEVLLDDNPGSPYLTCCPPVLAKLWGRWKNRTRLML